MTTQQILDTADVHGTEPTEILEEVLAIADAQIQIFQNSSIGSTDVLVVRLQALSAKIIPVLNRRRGSDGMTPLHP